MHTVASAAPARAGYGLRGRLLLSFIAISSFAVIAAVVGYYMFHTIGRALRELNDGSLPPAIVSLELAQRSERILAVGPTLLGVSSANELAGERFALDQEFKEAAEVIAELSKTKVSRTQRTECQTAFAQVSVNVTDLIAITQKRIASVDRKAELVRDLFETYSQFRIVFTPKLEDLQRHITVLRDTLQAADSSTEDRLAALEQLNAALRDLTPLEQIQQETARSFEALLRAANAGTRASLDDIRDQVTRSVEQIDKLASGLAPSVSAALIVPLRRLHDDALGDAGIIGARLVELETIGEGRRLTVQNSVYASRLSRGVDILVDGSKRGIAAATDQTLSVQRFGSAALLTVVV